MNLQVMPAGPAEKPRIAALLELYVYDFSEILGIDVGEEGRFVPPSLDKYFSQPRCHAFLFRVGEKLAGFALVEQKSRLTGDESVYDMADFFVLRKYRRQGVGARAAAWLFDHFRGAWEVRERRENVAGAAFWRRTIGRYTDGKFEDFTLDDERWHGPVQKFHS